MKKFCKKLISMLLALLMIVSITPISTYAATYITEMNSDAQFGVISGSYDDYGHELHYAKYDGKTYITFCCEFGVKSPTGTTYKYGTDFKKYLNRSGATYENIADYIAFGYTLVYGDGLPSTTAEKKAACATQQYVWEKLGVNPTRSSWNSTYMSDSIYKDWKEKAEARMSEYYDNQVSFNGSSKTVNLGGSTTITDSNGALKNYPSFTKTINKVTFSHTSGENTLKISVASDCTNHSVRFSSATEKIYKNLPNGSKYDATTMNYCYFEFQKGDIQDLMFSQFVDPRTFLLDVNVTFGNAQLTKTSEDGIVSGIEFTVTGGGNTYKMTTNSSGVAKLSNIPCGTYTVTEKTDIRYKTPNSKTITVSDGETANVSFNNVLKKGNIRIEKNSEDNLVSGLTFSVLGSDGSSYSATTNSSGVATVTNIPVYDKNNNKITYTVQETNVPIRYIPPTNQTVVLIPDTTSTLDFSNVLKKFRVTVTKVDIENSNPQGDASLAGAVYGIYKGNSLIDSYTTDSFGTFTTKYYVCDDDWTIKEIKASEGYNLDTTIYKIGAEPKNYTVEYNDCSNTVKEQVIKGNIAIIKHTDDGSTQIETAEKGAEFQIYLKSSGSFANAKSTEKDTIICDEDGFASSKLLPYGVYTVHQTKGWDGREKIKDFDVFIQSEGKTYKFLINNANFMSYLKVVKLDAETNKNIAYEGAGFEIYDTDGHRVTMQYTYPQVTSIHTFYTNSEGYLITPEKLPYGDYTLVEVQAPYGYVLDNTPIPFTISQDNSSTDTGVTVVKVKARDMAQKGVIEITKTGEVFASVNENEGIYTPVYETQNLANAVFQIYAAEDITTLDGTVRVQQGELVDEITTGANGVAKSKELYLGKYTVIEITAPNGYVNANEQYDVELTYAGQNVSVTSTALTVNNDRQKVTISLSKLLETNDVYGIGNNNEINSVRFGIFAGEDVVAKNGTTIPENTLVSSAYCDKDGFIKFECDLPIGFKWYVKEISADSHYIISDTQYDFDTDYQGQNVSVYEILINNGEKIQNSLKYGQVNGVKVDDDGNSLEGALIGIFRTDEKSFTKDTAIQTVLSGKDGTFSFSNIPYGEWIIKEISAPKGYVLDDTLHHIYITDDDVAITMLIENKLIRGNLEISKTDISSGEALANVGFRIFNKEKNVIAEGVTDENGKCTFENLKYGEYFYQEYSCYEAYVLDDTLYPFSITEDGVTIKAEMTNRMKQGSIIIHKTDASTGKPIANVGFRIYDANKNIIAEGKTDKDGNCTFENLVYGKYYYQEYACDDIYILDDSLYEFVICEDGQVIKAEMNNKLKPVPEIPKTADESNRKTLITIIGASSFALLCVAYSLIKKKKDNTNNDEGGNNIER